MRRVRRGAGVQGGEPEEGWDRKMQWWLRGKRDFFFLKSDCGLDTHLYREISDRCKLKENARIPNIMTIEKFI